MGISGDLGKALVPHLQKVAPDLTANFVHDALTRAIHGIGPLPPAARAAEKQLSEQHGNTERAIHEVIENNVRLAGVQGFVTNLGGLVTMAVMIPANISGLAVLQCRMVGGIAYLRGYDLSDPRVHNAILATILGEDRVAKLVKKKQLPSPPMGIATAPVHDPDLDREISSHVASELLTRVAGKRVAATIGRRVPVLGGVVGAGTDAFTTWQIGRYADRELRSRVQR